MGGLGGGGVSLFTSPSSSSRASGVLFTPRETETERIRRTEREGAREAVWGLVAKRMLGGRGEGERERVCSQRWGLAAQPMLFGWGGGGGGLYETNRTLALPIHYTTTPSNKRN